MSRVIGQRWEIYDYNKEKNTLLKRGEKVLVKNTPDYGESVIELVSNTKDRSIESLYLDWKNGVGSPFRTSADQDVIDAKTLADAKDYADEVSKNEWLKPVNTTEELQTTGLSNKKNYLCKVIADPVKSGIYQAIANWEDEPEWALYDDTVDLVNEQELAASISAHNTSEEAHEYIQGLISSEEAARIEAVSAEAQARNQAVTNEANTRASADTHLQNNINETNGNVADLRYDFNSWVGRGGLIDAFDFETATPTQQQLTDYALSQISTISDPLQIWNGTKVTNLFDGILWILTNTQNTNPTVFEWSPQGSVELAPFTPNMGGYIVGGDNNDPPEVVRPLLSGKGKIDLEAIKTLIKNEMFDEEHPVGDVVVQYPGTASPIEKNWRGQWVDWTARASAYRLRTNAIPSNTVYTKGANYAANAVVMWHLNGDDWGYFQAKAAITNADAQLNPVLWTQLKTGALVWRDKLQDINSWTAPDLQIGQQITRGGINYWIEEIIVFGGKFFSGTGGNRPPFESGGVAGDVIRDHKHLTGKVQDHTPGGTYTINLVGGVFNNQTSGVDNIPTGNENAPRTLAVQYWRRIA